MPWVFIDEADRREYETRLLPEQGSAGDRIDALVELVGSQIEEIEWFKDTILPGKMYPVNLRIYDQLRPYLLLLQEVMAAIETHLRQRRTG